MANVVLDHVCKRYPNGVEAVRDLDLAVAEGELLAVVGPSGCGKTTMLRLIAGLEAATDGTIAIGGRVVNQVAPRDRDVAMVFQHHVLYPHLTAYQNMAFALKLRRVPRREIDQAVRRAAAMLGIERLLHRRARELSGGERQRVALGRAIVRRPACFLLDEPLASLDARLRLEMRTELKQLHRQQGTTTIYVTHDQEEALALGDRVAVIWQGRLQQVGTPEEVYREPLNRFVAGFLGSAPMNFLEGTVVEHEGRLWFDEGSQRIALPDWAAAGLAGRAGGKVVLGVRPEAVHAEPIAGQRHNALDATVELIEPLGDKTDVRFATARHGGLLARLDARAAPRPAASCRLYLDLERIHFFAPDDESAGRPGANLCPAGQRRQAERRREEGPT